MTERPARAGYLGVGSNVGERRAHLEAAAAALPRHGVEVRASSSVYETQPVGEVADQRDFLNACLRIGWDGDPEGLLDACKAVESQLGRESGGPRHGPRVIDVDVLLLGDERLATPRIELPHPQAAARRFVLVPLVELDRELEIPGAGRAWDLLHALHEHDQRVQRAGPPLL